MLTYSLTLGYLYIVTMCDNIWNVASLISVEKFRQSFILFIT